MILKRIRRSIIFFFQRLSRGWDDRETWSLDYALAKWIIPRIERFKEIQNGYPAGLSEEKWDDIIDEIIWSFKWKLCDMTDDKKLRKKYMRNLDIKEFNDIFSKENREKYEEGMKLFAEYHNNLWW